MKVSPYVKAWMAAIGTTLMSLIVVIDKVTAALEDDVLDFNEVGVLVPIIAAEIATIAAVYGFRNKEETHGTI